jgi:hypothetical protein
VRYPTRSLTNGYYFDKKDMSQVLSTVKPSKMNNHYNKDRKSIKQVNSLLILSVVDSFFFSFIVSSLLDEK